jgi:hypothetical protein
MLPTSDNPSDGFFDSSRVSQERILCMSENHCGWTVELKDRGQGIMWWTMLWLARCPCLLDAVAPELWACRHLPGR